MAAYARLLRIEQAHGLPHNTLSQGVARPLGDLLIDWRPRSPVAHDGQPLLADE